MQSPDEFPDLLEALPRQLAGEFGECSREHRLCQKTAHTVGLATRIMGSRGVNKQEQIRVLSVNLSTNLLKIKHGHFGV